MLPQAPSSPECRYIDAAITLNVDSSLAGKECPEIVNGVVSAISDHLMQHSILGLEQDCLRKVGFVLVDIEPLRQVLIDFVSIIFDPHFTNENIVKLGYL